MVVMYAKEHVWRIISKKMGSTNVVSVSYNFLNKTSHQPNYLSTFTIKLGWNIMAKCL